MRMSKSERIFDLPLRFIYNLHGLDFIPVQNFDRNYLPVKFLFESFPKTWKKFSRFARVELPVR